MALDHEPNPSISIDEALGSRFPPRSESSSPTPARDYPPPLPPKPYAPEIRSRTASIKSSRSGNLPSLSLGTGGGYHGQATAGLSNEQASAPRNYVDFDPESAKLKEMLKTKGPTREAGIVDGFMPLFGRKSIEVDKEREWRLRNETIKPKKREKRLSSLSMSGIIQGERSGRASPLSGMFTSYSTPHSATPKSSPENTDGQRATENRLRLIAHYLPKRIGLSHRVVALEVLEGNRACLSLQESGLLSIVDTMDGRCRSVLEIGRCSRFAPPSTPGTGMTTFKPVPRMGLWKWKQMFLSKIGQSQVALLTAVDESPAFTSGRSEGNVMTQTTRCTVIKIEPESEWVCNHGSEVMKITADWTMDSFVECVGLVKENEDSAPPTLYHLNLSSDQTNPHLIASKLSLRPAQLSSHPLPPSLTPQTSSPANPFTTTQLAAPTTSSGAPSRSSTPRPEGQPSSLAQTLAVNLNVPNAFKGLKRKLEGVSSSKSSTKVDESHAGDIEVLMETDLGAVDLEMEEGVEGDLEDVRGMLVLGNAWTGEVVCCVWADACAKILLRNGDQWQTQILSFQDFISDIRFLKPANLLVLCEDHLENYSVKPFSKGDTQDTTELIIPRPRVALEAGTSAVFVTDDCEMITVESSKGCERIIKEYNPDDVSDETRRTNSVRLWSGPLLQPKPDTDKSSRQITAVLPLELEWIILGFADGNIASTSLTNLLSDTPDSYERISSHALDGSVIHISLTRVPRTGPKMVVGGGDDGSIAIYDAQNLKLLASWTVFVTPLTKALLLDDDRVGRLQGLLFAIAEDGTIATISPDGLDLLHVIPGSSAHLERICLGEDNLLLFYKDGRARLWDMKTLEFWRSMEVGKAEDLVAEGGWFDVSLVDSGKRERIWSESSVVSSHVDAASTLSLDLSIIENYIKSPKKLRDLRALLCLILPRDLNPDVNQLQIELVKQEYPGKSMASCGLAEDGFTLLCTSEDDWWSVSSTVTAERLLWITTLLRCAQSYPETERIAEQLIAFYAGSLQETFGDRYNSPSLSRLSEFWYHPLSEVRQSARSLFEATVAMLKDEDTIRLVDEWKHRLPCLQPDASKVSSHSAQALLVCGYIAAEKYSMIVPTILTDISKSIVLYLHDDVSPHRVVAIDLCAKGFQIWQNYVDAMELLRSMFTLATSDGTVSSAGRHAVLQIASGSTPLFMTTLTLDIIHPRSVEQQKSIMQLVAFLIRRRPLVLLPSLPRLAEAVVKSLDPNSAAGRDVILEAATEILSQIVKTYPCVDFHMHSQRLAVGTSEGAVVLYDLKTATRLYVLEGHRKRTTACSFSPDGRRLATVSVEERVALVWKVGSSFTSFFKPGAPPNQGHGNSRPYKTFPFTIVDQRVMSLSSTLEQVKFEWTADRNVRLTIRDNIMSFNA